MSSMTTFIDTVASAITKMIKSIIMVPAREYVTIAVRKK